MIHYLLRHHRKHQEGLPAAGGGWPQVLTGVQRLTHPTEHEDWGCWLVPLPRCELSGKADLQGRPAHRAW